MRTRKIVESEHVLNHGRHVNCCSRRDGFNMLHSGSNASPVEFVAVAGFCFKLVLARFWFSQVCVITGPHQRDLNPKLLGPEP